MNDYNLPDLKDYLVFSDPVHNMFNETEIEKYQLITDKINECENVKQLVVLSVKYPVVKEAFKWLQDEKMIDKDLLVKKKD